MMVIALSRCDGGGKTTIATNLVDLLNRCRLLLGRFFHTLLMDKLVVKLKDIGPDIIIAHNIPGAQIAH